MAVVLDPQHKRALAERIRFYNELGIYDFYRRGPSESNLITPDAETQLEQREEMTPRANAAVEEDSSRLAKPELNVTDPVQALRLIREDLGDCTRCVLHKQGRKQIVFGVGNAKADLMFIGEAPGADEDMQGELPRRLAPVSCSITYIKSHGPAAGSCLHCEHYQVPSAGKSDAGAGRVRDLLPFFNAADDRGHQTERPLVALGAVAAKNIVGVINATSMF